MAECFRVRVDELRCAASTTCVSVAPDLFELPAGALSAAVKVALVDDPELVEQLREAEDACPTLAITVEPVDAE